MKFDANDYQAFLEYQSWRNAKEAAGLGTLDKAVATTNVQQMIHGPGSLFGIEGLSPEVFNAMMQVRRGLASILPHRPSRFTDPKFAILTGQEADNGTEPTASCDDPVRAGFKKMGTLTAQFGMLQRGTETIDITKVGELLNRGEFTDLMLMGLYYDNNTTMSLDQFKDPSRVFNNAIYAAMNGVAFSFERALSTQLWSGSPTGGTDGYTEFPGLDNQITTGQVNSENNVAMPAADSDVKDFNYSNVDGTDTNDIVQYISMLEYYLTDVAYRTGLEVDWVFVMRSQLWEELTNVWPIAYVSTQNVQVINNTNARLMIDARSEIDRRDAMRANKRLYVRGKDYQVIIDDGITEQNNITNGNLNAGEYSSNIYMVPLRANGFPVTRLEHLDYNEVGRQLSQIPELASRACFWTPDGRFMWAYRDDQGFCFDLISRTQQRVVLQTPYLAGRINNVKYSPLQHLRSPYPDNAYFLNGGTSTNAEPTSYAVWKS